MRIVGKADAAQVNPTEESPRVIEITRPVIIGIRN
jgi:hypothetical protein